MEAYSFLKRKMKLRPSWSFMDWDGFQQGWFLTCLQEIVMFVPRCYQCQWTIVLVAKYSLLKLWDLWQITWWTSLSKDSLNAALVVLIETVMLSMEKWDRCVVIINLSACYVVLKNQKRMNYTQHCNYWMLQRDSRCFIIFPTSSYVIPSPSRGWLSRNSSNLVSFKSRLT